MKLVSGIWRGINRINKFIQSFQVDVVRCAQSDLKEQVRFFHIDRLSQKEVIARGISKILVRGLNVFRLQQISMVMNWKFLYKCTPQAENFLNSPEKLTHLLLKILMTVFSF